MLTTRANHSCQPPCVSTPIRSGLAGLTAVSALGQAPPSNTLVSWHPHLWVLLHSRVSRGHSSTSHLLLYPTPPITPRPSMDEFDPIGEFMTQQPSTPSQTSSPDHPDLDPYSFHGAPSPPTWSSARLAAAAPPGRSAALDGSAEPAGGSASVASASPGGLASSGGFPAPPGGSAAAGGPALPAGGLTTGTGWAPERGSASAGGSASVGGSASNSGLPPGGGHAPPPGGSVALGGPAGPAADTASAGGSSAAAEPAPRRRGGIGSRGPRSSTVRLLRADSTTPQNVLDLLVGWEELPVAERDAVLRVVESSKRAHRAQHPDATWSQRVGRESPFKGKKRPPRRPPRATGHGKLPRGAAGSGCAAGDKSAVGGRETGGHAAIASGASRELPVAGGASGERGTYGFDCP